MKKYTKLLSMLVIAVMLVGTFICSTSPLAVNKSVLGDVNDDSKVNVIDANMIRRHCAHLITLTTEQLANADVNGDGLVNIVDANILRRYSAELISTLPASSVKFTVTFMNYDWTVLKTEEVLCGQAATPPTVPARDGYTFTGWNGEYTNITGDIILVAQFTETVVGGEYTVIFKDYDETVLKTETVVSGNDATPPEVPYRNGYRFTGWNGEYTNITSDRILVAQYEVITEPSIVVHNVTANAGDDTVQVVISIQNNPGIASIMLRVAYGDILTLQSVSFDPAFGSFVTAPEPFANPQAISLMSPLADIEASGTFATLTFKIADTAESGSIANIDITYDQSNTFNSDFDEVEFDVINGKVTIK